MTFSVYWFVLRKMFVKERFGNNIKYLKKYFSYDIVANMERIFRIETNNFKSNQFLHTFSPGMEKFSNEYPYGWNTLQKILWSKNTDFKPIGYKSFKESKTGIKKYFLIFPSLLASQFTVCAFLEYYNNNPGRWFSTDTEKQKSYNNAVQKFSVKLTNENYV